MMRNTIYIMFSVVLIAAFVTGCGTTKNPALENAFTMYNEANANPDISTNAQVDMHEAAKLLAQAEKAEKESDKTHLAELASKRVQMAKANANQKMDEKKMETIKKEKQNLLLESRQREADKAKTEAERAKMDAERARTEAERARMDVDAKGRELAAQTQEAEMARRQTEGMRQEAEAKAKEADDARKQAEDARRQAESAKAEAELLKKELSDLKAKETERGLVLTLGDVLFATAKAELNYNAMRNLDKLAEFLKKYPNRDILVEGHTDSRGSESMNLTLSQNRADSVRSALVSRGVDGTRITARGYGKSQPVADNSTESGRSQNRRVEIVILKEGRTQ